MRRALLLSVAAIVLTLTPGTASAEPASCPVGWGSLTKTEATTTSADMVGLRAGRHACFDRLVFDFRGEVDGYWVSYVDQVTAEATGDVVAVRGGARLQVSVHARAHDDRYKPTYLFGDAAKLVDVASYQTFRQVAWAGSQHGTTSVGLGTRARLPFRVFALPNRIVVDVAHRW